MHEIRHIVLGYTVSDSRSGTGKYATERFTIDVLDFAYVLWRSIQTAKEIAELCNILIMSAKIREKRMQDLYDSKNFLLHRLNNKF